MSTQVLAGYVATAELQKVFRQLKRPGALLILEGITDLLFQRVESEQPVESEKIDPAAYEEGRMFDDAFELHWQRLRGYPLHVPPFRVTVICDDASQLASIDSHEWQASSGKSAEVLPLAGIGEGEFFLWGEAVRDVNGQPTGDWYEKAVPRLFRYPVDNAASASRVKLVTRSYRLLGKTGDEEDTVILHRFTALSLAQE